MTRIVDRVVERYKAAGDVVKLRKPKGPKVPTLAIRGRKYALSDYWPFFSEVTESEGEGGARLIDVGGGTRYRYLWAYDTDRQAITMWRVSDGEEKHYSRASGEQHLIVTLEKKGQLNRVTHDEFVDIERHMRQQHEATLQSLRQYLEENADDWDRRVKDILRDHYEKKLKPEIERRLSELDRGVKPFGFKVNPGILEFKSAEEQARSFVIANVLSKFTQEEAYKVVSNAVGFDAYEPPQGDPQAVQWQWGELLDEAYREFKS